MNRMMTEEHEATCRGVAAVWKQDHPQGRSLVGPLLAELDASREVEAALLAALKMALLEVQEHSRDYHHLTTAKKFHQISDAIAMAETPEGYELQKTREIQLGLTNVRVVPASPELDSTMYYCNHCESYHADAAMHIKRVPGNCKVVNCGVCLAQSQERAHAREVEDTCLSCGARTFSGICSAKCGG